MTREKEQPQHEEKKSFTKPGQSLMSLLIFKSAMMPCARVPDGAEAMKESLPPSLRRRMTMIFSMARRRQAFRKDGAAKRAVSPERGAERSTRQLSGAARAD